MHACMLSAPASCCWLLKRDHDLPCMVQFECISVCCQDASLHMVLQTAPGNQLHDNCQPVVRASLQQVHAVQRHDVAVGHGPATTTKTFDTAHHKSLMCMITAAVAPLYLRCMLLQQAHSVSINLLRCLPPPDLTGSGPGPGSEPRPVTAAHKSQGCNNTGCCPTKLAKPQSFNAVSGT